MAQLALTAAGAVGGFFVGGPLGAQLGAAAGSILGNFILGPGGQDQKVEGPRLDNLQAQTSRFGEILPILYGTMRLPGKVIWASGIQEFANTETVEAGKGGGGPETTTTTYYYTASWCSAFNARQAGGVRRIWFDAVLVYDVSDDATDATRAASEVFADAHFSFYPGAEDDSVDPTISTYEGAANTPAFRGICKIVFSDILLADYGNRIPSVTAEITGESASTIDWTSEHPDDSNWVLQNFLSRHYYGTEPPGGLGLNGLFKLEKTFSNDGENFKRGENYNFHVDFRTQTSGDGIYLSVSNVDLVNASIKYDVNGAGSLLSFTSGGIADSWSISDRGDDWYRLTMTFDVGSSTNSGRTLYLRAGGCDLFAPYAEFKFFFAEEMELRYPSFRGLTAVEASGELLRDVIADICERCGLTLDQIDVSAIPQTTLVNGYAVGGQSGRSALENLAKAYFFDIVESQGKLKFVPRGGTSVATIAVADMAIGIAENAQGEALTITRGNELELPRRVSCTYMQANKLYQQGEAHSQRIITDSVGEQNTDLRLSLSDEDAGKIPDVMLHAAWAERVRFSFSLPIEYYYLDPGDIITLNDDGTLYTVRLVAITLENLALLRCEAVGENPALYTSTWTGDGGTADDASVSEPGETVTHMLDVPMLTAAQNDPRIYYVMAAETASWYGARLYRSRDGGANYESIAAVSIGGITGIVAAALGSSQYHTWDDETTIDVELDNPAHTLESRSDIAVLNGANACIIGAHGRWEVIQYAAATLVSGSTYRISRLLRGRLGTEHNRGNHAASDTFVLLAAGRIRSFASSLAELQLERLYKGVGVGQDIADVTQIAHTYTGENLRPRSPVHIAGSRDGSNNLTVTAVRRSRFAPRMLHTPILGEASETYELDVMSGSSVLRTITGSTLSFSYTAAQQTTDGLTPGDPVEVWIYQISEAVGRGTPGKATV